MGVVQENCSLNRILFCYNDQVTTLYKSLLLHMIDYVYHNPLLCQIQWLHSLKTATYSATCR